MESPSDVVGVALAGGASSRMGRDKTALRLPPAVPTGGRSIAGRTLLEWTVERLGSACREVVVADRGRGLVAGAASVADGPGAGPAAGILGAAAARPDRRLLVLACDLPRVPAALLAALAAEPLAAEPLAAAGTGTDWVVPVWGDGHYEPLCALYGPGALAALAARVRRGAYAVHRLAGEAALAVRRLDEAALAAFGRPAEIFANVNTPADLAALALRREEGGG